MLNVDDKFPKRTTVKSPYTSAAITQVSKKNGRYRQAVAILMLSYDQFTTHAKRLSEAEIY